ncbi:MAG: hypothetical protein HOK21_22395 [Rhodospirillaceae bacterium]|jgi:Asp-tRNA(Asn)/Glu-tRNA(Gln) amidotransferase C subunit|nr:hypothetical protein [Rhodospirillaceae bacterium]MBT4045301.1 hypothetical protein [Rhodospirillaceae bacterium]MBT4690284.1 hypothetical protein [Rhodospirillaceae bacterium]MBT5083281.1 hypothetical protein [Rhodospirillaceae bacterium]MBT5526844.1 hypothetical protein [Rhodospirillaceae bacterium]
MQRTPVKKEDIAAMAKAARLDIPEGRAELLVETMDEVFQMLDSLDGVELGETAPAFAYRAKWEGK